MTAYREFPEEPDSPPPALPTSLAGRAVRGVLWSTVSFGGSRLVTFLVTLGLARLLAPEDFGVVAGGLTLITFLEIALDLGLGAAVVYEQEQGVTSRVRTAYTLNLVVAVVLTLMAILAAPVVAELLHVENSVGLLRVLFCYLILRGAGQVQTAVLQRDLRYRERTTIDLTRAGVRGAASLALAAAGTGAWAIVVGMLAGEAAGLALAWWYVGLLPTLRLERPVVRALLHFSLAMLGLKVLGALVTSGDDFIVGNRLGPTALGLFTVAARLPELTIESVHWIVASVSFSLYAKARRHGAEAFRETMLRALRLVTLFGFSAGTGLAILAPTAIPVLFSAKWEPAAGAAVFLALAMGLGSVGYASGDVFPAVGRPRTLLRLTAAMTVTSLVGYWISAPYGITAVAVVALAVQVVFGAIRLYLGNRLVGSTWSQVFTAIAPAVASAAGIACLALPLSLVLPRGPVALLVISTAGLLGAVLGIAVAGRPAVHDLVGLLRKAFP